MSLVNLELKPDIVLRTFNSVKFDGWTNIETTLYGHTCEENVTIQNSLGTNQDRIQTDIHGLICPKGTFQEPVQPQPLPFISETSEHKLRSKTHLIKWGNPQSRQFTFIGINGTIYYHSTIPVMTCTFLLVCRYGDL